MGDLATGSDRVGAKAGKGAKVARAEGVGKEQRALTEQRVAGAAARVARVARVLGEVEASMELAVKATAQLVAGRRKEPNQSYLQNRRLLLKASRVDLRVSTIPRATTAMSKE